MPVRLVALAGGPDILVARTLVVVGRNPGCEARLGSSRISRRHCCLAETAGGVEVRDLGSTNGVWINGRRVESGRLRPGDELSIAHVRYRMEEDPASGTCPTGSHPGPATSGSQGGTER